MNQINSTAPQTEDRHYRRFGLIVLISLIIIVGGWGSFAPLSSAISAPGKVSVASSNRIIQHLEGGIVKAILVEEGQKVKVGEVIIKLDTTHIDAELNIALTQYIESLAQEARLIAEYNGKTAVQFPSELDILCQNISCNNIFSSQINEFNARHLYKKSQTDGLTQQIEQLHNQVASLQKTIEANNYLSQSYAQEIKEWKILFDQQLTDKLHLREIERQKIKVDGDIASSYSEIARLNGRVSEIKIQFLTIEQGFIKEVAEHLSELRTHLSDLRLRITALRDILNRTQIISPVEGMITNLQLHTVGGVISPAKPILEIVPLGERLIIDGRVNANEVSNIHTGLLAEIRFPGFAHIKTLNIVEGEVIHIAPDALSDEATGILYYPVKISVTPQGEQELIRNHLAIQPGIPADTMIVIGKRTMLDYLIQPLKKMFSKSFNEE